MPQLKAIEQAAFGGVDSRSNPITMPQNRFLVLRNWLPRVDGHLELRDGYTLQAVSPSLAGGGALHSLYSFRQIVATGAVVGSTAVVISHSGGLPNPIPTDYWVVLVKETAGGLSSTAAEVGPLHLDGAVTPQVINIPQDDDAVAWRAYYGTAPGAETAYVRATRSTVSAAGWTLTLLAAGSVSGTVPSGTKACVLVWQGKVPYVVQLDTMTVFTPAIRQDPIASSNRWSYALGKNGFIYMHNGVDRKFFDGFSFRDIGLPVLTNAMIANISVNEGLSAPAPVDTNACTFTEPASVGDHAPIQSTQIFLSFFDTASNTLAPGATMVTGSPFPGAPAFTDKKLQVNVIPSSSITTAVGVFTMRIASGPFINDPLEAYSTTTKLPTDSGVLTSPTSTKVNVHKTAHGLTTGDVIVLTLTTSLGGPSNTVPVTWNSNGPFAITVVDADNFTFNTPEAVLYSGGISYYKLVVVPNGTTTAVIPCTGMSASPRGVPFRMDCDLDKNVSGAFLLPNTTTVARFSLLPPTAIGGDQPGYQFYVSIYNPHSGHHVGNRVPIGQRLANSVGCTVEIDGLPDLSAGVFSTLDIDPTNQFYRPRARLGGGAGRGSFLRSTVGVMSAPTTMLGDTEWVLLIGRTGDGGEVPYALIDEDGNWITTTSYNQSSITTTAGVLDNNSELPTENDIPVPFFCFWREGDRQCGTVEDQPFVFRSASELDDSTGIFVGDPAQSWLPTRVETFPTADAIIGGYGYMQESWVFTMADCAQLSELSGEVSWNGPYNFGNAGAHAFDKGWKSLPFWISHDKQLCTMLSEDDGPIGISTEYETALLARIGDAYRDQTELVYFRDPLKIIEVLQIKCVDSDGNPFTVIHDFHLRDDASPFGQGYEYDFTGPLATVYTEAPVRDADEHARMWAGGADGNLYQFYTGGADDVGGTPTEFVADAINLHYLSGERAALKTLEWYGDDTVIWFLRESLADTTYDSSDWVLLSDQSRPFPTDEGNNHFQTDVDRPEMIHCYLWAQLTSHSADAPDPTDPKAFNVPPHMPVEFYGRLYLAAPILGDVRGR